MPPAFEARRERLRCPTACPTNTEMKKSLYPRQRAVETDLRYQTRRPSKKRQPRRPPDRSTESTLTEAHRPCQLPAVSCQVCVCLCMNDVRCVKMRTLTLIQVALGRTGDARTHTHTHAHTQTTCPMLLKNLRSMNFRLYQQRSARCGPLSSNSKRMVISSRGF